MGKITRAGIALGEELLEKFDDKIKRKKYKNRSEAIRDLIRANLVEDEWKGNHLDERNCLEVIVVKGRSTQVQELADALIGTRGVLHGKLTATSVGQAIERSR